MSKLTITLEELAAKRVTKPKYFHWNKLPTDYEYEVGLEIQFGINEFTCGAKRITTGHTIIPPGNVNERHVHLAAEAAMYIIKGNPVLFIGEEAEEAQVGPGTFVYMPEGVLHGIGNPSDTEEVELVFSYGGVPSKEAAKTTFIKGDNFPRSNWKEDWSKQK